MEVLLLLHGPEIVPREIKTFLKSGAVSKKPATEAFLHQTYQAHVCSCVLRVARELFGILPFQKIFVHGVTPCSIPRPETRNHR